MEVTMHDYHHQAALPKARYGYCDSYFVESHDDQQRRHRHEIQERERLHKMQVQLAIAEDLSEQASQDYRDDHLSAMERMEVSNDDPSVNERY